MDIEYFRGWMENLRKEPETNEYLQSISNSAEEVLSLISFGGSVFCLVSTQRLALYDLGNPEPALELPVRNIENDFEVPKGKWGDVTFHIVCGVDVLSLTVPSQSKDFFASALRCAIENSVNFEKSPRDAQPSLEASDNVDENIEPTRETWELSKIPSNVAWKTFPNHLDRAIRENSSPEETPLFFISDVLSWEGSLVALKDRCLVIKSGAVGGLLSHSLGGSRVSTIYYRDITGIEYNSGFMNGVLEILTPSYQGTTNKDYWRGFNAALNTNADDPRAISNTLPLTKNAYRAASSLIAQLRQLVRDSKELKVTLNSSGSVSLADELAKLAELKSQGIISDSDFEAAKAKLFK